VSSTQYPALSSSRKWPELPLWIAGAALATVCVVDGILQFAGRSAFVPLPSIKDLPQWLGVIVGCVEIAAAICLVMPWLVSLGAILLGLIMVGGMVANLQVGNSLLLFAPLSLSVGLAIIGYQLSPQVSSVRRLRSVLDVFADGEILREEIRRQSHLTTALASEMPGTGHRRHQRG
jgi:uncharacterized membrane protein YphA (DoxX/SURF4 family)